MRQLKLVRSQEEKRRAAQMEARVHLRVLVLFCLLLPRAFTPIDVVRGP
jgi:hypothetical protein